MNGVVRLAVDARDLLSDTRGIGRYTRAILPRLAQRDDIEITLLLFGPLVLARRNRLRAVAGSDRIRFASRALGCDVLWHPANGTFFSPSAANVVTIHDVQPFRFPHENARKRRHQQEPFLRSARQAQRVITVSRFARQEIENVLGIQQQRIDVIYHGVDSIFAPGPAELLPPELAAKPYVLFVGDPQAEPRKNFSMLDEAYRKAFVDTDERPRLVVTGQLHPLPSDAQLRDLYRGASALCVPSYYEGFGMPILEAMACGAPVIASNASCLPEIGGDAALYAPPHDVDAWSDALRRITRDQMLRSHLRETGLHHVRAFSWDASAQRHAEIFHSL